jgi:hypothetical protein
VCEQLQQCIDGYRERLAVALDVEGDEIFEFDKRKNSSRD